MNELIDKIIYDALEEDIPTLDITSDNLLHNEQGEAILIAKENGVVSGINIVQRLFQVLDDEVFVKVINYDGTYIEENDIIAIISGNLHTILKGQRLALNFIQRMSGIATKTKSFVDQVEDTFVKIIDSRNTTPNFRYLEKIAVNHGGGGNSRRNLSEQVSITQNHIEVVGSASKAVELLSERTDQSINIEVEVNTFEQFLEVIHTKCDIIIFRDMMHESIRKCCTHNTNKLVGTYLVNTDELKTVSKTGVDFIIIDELTHSYNLLDIKLNITK